MAGDSSPSGDYNMITDLSNEFISEYNKNLNKLMPFFSRISNKNTEENRFMSIALALRIAAKLCQRFGYSKEAFIDAANGNFDLEHNEIVQKNIDININ